MVSPNAPPGESPALLETERTVLAGIFLMCVAYGMEFMLFLATAYLLIRKSRIRQSWAILTFIFVEFALATIATGCAIQGEVFDFVDNRNFPGGPIAFSFVDGSDPVYLTLLMAFNLMAFLQDGYLLYRFLIIWNRNWWIFLFPFLLYLSSVGTSLLMWARILMSGAPFLAKSHVDLGLINWVLSIATNVVLTALIILRIMLARRAALGIAGREHVQTYLSVSMMLVESQSIYAVIGIVVLASVTTNPYVTNVLANTFGIMEAFAPTLVAYRVAKGTAWTRETAELSSLHFIAGQTPHTSGITGTTDVGNISIPIDVSMPSPLDHQSSQEKISAKV